MNPFLYTKLNSETLLRNIDNMIKCKYKQGVGMKKNEMTEATVKCFAKDGLDFEMSSVAEELGISLKELEEAFPTKEELMLATLEKGFVDIQKEKERILALEIPTIEKLKKVMSAMPDQYGIVDFRKLERLKHEYPRVADALMEELEANWQPIFDLIDEGIINGEIRKISTVVFQTMFNATLNAFLTSDILMDNGIEYYSALAEIVEVLIEGVRLK